MIITEVQIVFCKPNNGLIGFASLVVDKSLYLTSIAIHTKLDSEGYRLTYPSKGQRCLFHPINKVTSQIVEQAIFDKLKDVMKRQANDRYSDTLNPYS